jgi:hypothetical protein
VKVKRQNLFWFMPVILISVACGATNNSLSNFVAQAVSPSPTPTPQIFNITPTSVISGLEQLDSYRANLIVDTAGVLDGKPAAGHFESLTEVNRPQSIQRTYLYIDNPPDAPAISDFYRIQNQIYIVQGEETKQFTIEAGQPYSPAAAGLLELETLIILPQRVSTQPQITTIDEHNALRYTFDQSHLNSSNLLFRQAQGEVWVAVPGNYVLQYVISATVKTIAPPTTHIIDEGSLTIRYRLADINAAIAIIPPTTDIGATPFANFPPPPEAEIIAIYPTLIEYSSAISPISATLFYQSGLPPQGWIEEQMELFEEKARLVYSKDKHRLTILITPADIPPKIKIALNMETRP